jgi:hypothetical protein
LSVIRHVAPLNPCRECSARLVDEVGTDVRRDESDGTSSSATCVSGVWVVVAAAAAAPIHRTTATPSLVKNERTRQRRGGEKSLSATASIVAYRRNRNRRPKQSHQRGKFHVEHPRWKSFCMLQVPARISMETNRKRIVMVLPVPPAVSTK